MYYMVFGALIVGTILTVAAAKVDMGALNNVVMLAIALHEGDARHPVLHARPVGLAAHVGGRDGRVLLAADPVQRRSAIT